MHILLYFVEHEIIDNHLSELLHMKILGICGPSASGKSTLAQNLCDKYSKECAMIGLDNYFKNYSEYYARQNKWPNLDDPCAIDFDLLIQHLSCLKENQTIESPVYDLKTFSRTHNVLVIEPKPVLILEGFLIFQNPDLLNIIDRKIYIDTDIVRCLLRRLKRGMQNYQDADTLIEYFEQYAYPCYHQYIRPSQKFADRILKNENISELFQELDQEVVSLLMQ